MVSQKELKKIEQSNSSESQDIFPILESVIQRYEGQGALIPALQSAQNLLGWLPEEIMTWVSRRLNISFSEVAGVVGFYSFFSTNPRGKFVVRVCLGTACYVRGGQEVLSALEKELEIRVGETTEDRQFSLEIGRCFGACGLAPVVMINDNVHQRVRPATVSALLKDYREEDDNE
jgi:NADH:ubiquinone oxidoreductase subunit E